MDISGQRIRHEKLGFITFVHRRLGVWAWLVALSLLLAACGGGGVTAADNDDTAADSDVEDEGSVPDVLRIAIPGDAENLDVMRGVGTVTRSWIGPNVAETLASWDIETGEIVPLLAEAWEQVDDEQWEVTLREGVHFPDGREMNSQDAVDSINYGMSDDSSFYSTFYPTVEEAEVIDDYRFRLNLLEADPVLPRRLAFLSVVPSELLDEDTLATTLEGTGPYRVSEWRRGQSIRLERNPEYWGDPPQYDAVEFLVRPESGVRANALQAGEIEMAMLIDPEQADQVPQLVSVPGAEVAGFVFNSVGQGRDSITQDIRVRQALNHAIDRDAVVEGVFSGLAVLPQGQFNTQEMTGTDPDVQDFAYDPDLARELLEEAGVLGETIRIGVSVGRHYKGQEVAEATAQFIRDVGMEVELDTLEHALWLETYRGNATGADNPYDLFSLFHANEFFESGMKTFDALRSMDAGGGFYLIADAEVDRLANEARNEADPDARLEAMQATWRKLHEESYLMTIAVAEFLYGTSDNINWQPRADEVLYLRDVVWED